MPSFGIEFDPAVGRLCELSRLDPANPFYTPEYAAYRRQQGERALLIRLADGERIVHGCTGFLRSGRLSCSLDIPSRPALPEALNDDFWLGLRAFCRSQSITLAQVCSFASKAGAIPRFNGEASRKLRWEFVIELAAPAGLVGTRKGHAYEIKRGRQAGLQLRRTRDPQALLRHVELMNASMERRRGRGEAVGVVEQGRGYGALLATGAAELFQAVAKDDVVSSNMILLAPGGGYNHTQGTSAAGMECGAAHFLLSETAASLLADGRNTLNLGGTDQAGGGLERFKSGFSKATQRIELEAASFQFGGRAGALWGAAKRLFARP
jgi:GNAT acetyltransferase-like protein